MTEMEILEEAYRDAQQLLTQNYLEKIEVAMRADVDYLIADIQKNKSLISVVATSLAKKISDPEQDVRLHRTEFDGGYSARSFDTKYTTPFFKRYFPRYANKETGFLTRTTRQSIKWTIDEGKSLSLRNAKLKEHFLNIFEQIEEQKTDAKISLIYLFARLIELVGEDELTFHAVKGQTVQGVLNIYVVLEMLREHFAMKRSSRLPVIAIYAIYEVLIPLSTRFRNAKLQPLQTHTSSDKRGFGDIEIYTSDEQPFEIVEVKHNIPIDMAMVFDIVKKMEGVNVDRYYILTTCEEGFESAEIEQSVYDYTLQIHKTRNLDIIPNGIFPTLKYYLRLVDDYADFIAAYSRNLVVDAQNSTEVTPEHLKVWSRILSAHKKRVAETT